MVNVGGNVESERDKKSIDAQIKSEDEILAKSRAGNASLANLREAVTIAKRLGPENFGTVAKATLYPRKLLSGLGVTDENAENILGDQILISQISLGFTMDIVSRTKGAISNREMEMFEKGSPGLGSNYNGFMKQSEYLFRIAKRDVDFNLEYVAEAERLEDLEDKGELRPSQVKRKLNAFEAQWYNDHLIFSKDEEEELKAIIKGGYVDEDGMAYTVPEGFNVDEYISGYREGQNKTIDQKSSYTSNKIPAINSLNRKKEEIQARTDLPLEQRNNLISAIDEQIANLKQ